MIVLNTIAVPLQKKNEKMKRLILALLVIMALSKQGFCADKIELIQPQMQVDSTDTVYFDLSNLSVSGDTAFFPVYIASDDSVYALDFSFKFDLDSMEYATTIKLAGYLDFFGHFNANDSTFRFTSFSNNLQPYGINTSLIKVGFLTTQSSLSGYDFYDSTALLNGSPCIAAFLNPPIVGINEINQSLPLNVYPNPAAGTVYIHTKHNAEIILYSATGEVVCNTIATNELLNAINIDFLKPGVYLIRVSDGKSSAMQKLTKL